MYIWVIEYRDKLAAAGFEDTGLEVTRHYETDTMLGTSPVPSAWRSLERWPALSSGPASLWQRLNNKMSQLTYDW
ncbi:MAG TPA: hypothetical protein PL078_04775 [Bacillota bacterium]|nr:hypothetical protein [Peptococcaceae bacterium MAG4]NLW37314.1 hypothetical protein [Peptococcaceae bacterium]HPZ43301.1 hypothetical protein [Bacillota bacterium]HQD75172.1 hypothetical protein [Bacillota bacterium]HUM57864.1 hypothetical protein [Bacillota bacterium]